MSGVVEAGLLLASLYLPGHALGGRISRKGDGWAELVMLRACCAVAVATPILVALALLGLFSTAAIVCALVASAAVSAVAVRLLPGGGYAARFGGWDVAVLGFGVLAFALYARPAEYVINDRDPGVYAIAASKLARTGELLSRDPLVGAIVRFHDFNAWTKYPGFYIYGDDLIVPQFFPGPFAWLGFGNLVGGIWGELYVVPLFGALSVVAAFLLGKELFGRWAGAVGAALLLTSYAQVWWSRHPSSEVMTQFFVLGGLLLAARFANGAGGGATGGAAMGSGLLGGLLLGGAMLVRVDAFLAAAVVPLLMGRDLALRRPLGRWLFLCVPLAVFGGAALLYANTIGGRYLYLLYSRHGLDRALKLSPYALGAALLLALALWAARRRWHEAAGRLLQVHWRTLTLSGTFLLVAGALWAYLVMPEPWTALPDHVAGFDAYDRQVAARMVWFVTPPVALLGLAGFLIAARRATDARLLLLGAVAGFGVFYVVEPNVAPDLPWATRRFVPAVFPGFCLLAGFGAVEAGRALRGRLGPRTGPAVSVALPAALAGALAAVALGWTVHTALPVYPHRELGGAVAAFGRVDREIPNSDVVFVELPGDFDHYASTLEYLHARPVLAYDPKEMRKEIPELEDAGLLDDAAYVTVDGEDAPRYPGLTLREVGREALELPRLAPTFKSVPDDAYEERMVFRVFEVDRR